MACLDSTAMPADAYLKSILFGITRHPQWVGVEAFVPKRTGFGADVHNLRSDASLVTNREPHGSMALPFTRPREYIEDQK